MNSWVALSAASLAWAVQVASTPPFPNWQTLFFVSGTCERLVTPDQDRSAGCLETVVHMIYRDGRRSYAFTDGQAAMISFSGVEEASDDQRGTLTLDLISIATAPGPQIGGGHATGTCEFSNPYRGRSYIRCSGRTASGEFSASFTSDGQPPRRQDF